MLKLKTLSSVHLLLSLSFIGFAFVTQSYSQFLNAKYEKDKPNLVKTSNAKIRLDDEKEKPHTLVGSYYTTRNGFTSNLLLNNKGPQPLEVLPILYSKSGQVLQIAPIVVPNNSYQTINLKDWADTGGQDFREGNIRLFHRGKDIVLGTQIQIIDERKSLVFEHKLVELGKFDSRRLETVWWNPTNRSQTNVVLTNTSDNYTVVTATLYKKNGNVNSPQSIDLLPHETKVFDLRNDFNQGNTFANSDAVGLSLTHTGQADSILALTMIKNESLGYSYLAGFNNPQKNESNEYHGAGLQIGKIGNDDLEQIVILRNTSDNQITVNIKVPYTKENGTQSNVQLSSIKLKPKELYKVDMSEVDQLRNVKVAGIEIKYSGNPGDVIATAQSVSQSRTQVFGTILWDPPTLKSAASIYPFSIEGTSTTKAYIKNAGFKDELYMAYLTWGTDGEYVIPIETIKKGETIEIDVKKLRDEQIPDEKGKAIPLDVTKGQIHWTLRRTDDETTARANRVPLIGQMEQVDTVKGISYTYFCLNCCDYAYSYATLVPSNTSTQAGVSFNYTIYEDGKDCYGNNIYSRNVTSQGYNWISSNTNVATVNSSGQATTVAGGTTEIKVKINLPYYMTYGPCDGGGPFFSQKGGSCKDKEDSKVTFSKASYISSEPAVSALIPQDCDCLTRSNTFNLSANLTVYQVVIKRDGQPITSSNNTVIVGERINLTAEVVPNNSVSNHSWTLPTTVVKDFVVSAGNSQGNKVDVDGLNTASVSFAWVDGGGANVNDFVSKEVKYDATVNGQSLMGKSTFHVKRPLYNLLTVTSQTSILPNTNGSQDLIFATNNDEGIVFKFTGIPQIPPPYGNTSQWVQIVNQSNNTITPSIGPPFIDNKSGLDGCYPYKLPRGIASVLDSPSLGLPNYPSNYTATASVTSSFTMWFMYNPNPSGDGVWVPLKKVDWYWNPQAMFNGASWTITSTMDHFVNPAFIDTVDFPQWTNVVPYNGQCQ